MYIIIAISVLAIMTLLLNASKKKAKRNVDGNTILRLPYFYFIIGVICSLFCVGIGVFGLLNSPKEDWFFIVIVCLIFFSLGLYLTLSINHNVIISDQFIEEINFFRQRKKIKWSEIEKIKFGIVSQMLKIQGSKTKIKVHLHMIGFKELVAKIEDKTKFDKNEIRLPKNYY